MTILTWETRKFRAQPGKCARAVGLSSLAGIAAICGVPVPAAAQEAVLPQLSPIGPPIEDRGIDLDVTRRPHPEFDPVPLRLGNWDLVPSVEASGGYATNLYGEPSNSRSAAFVQVEPALVASSTTSSSVIRGEASGRFAGFIGQSQANETSYRGAVYGRYALTREFSVEANAEIAQLVERRDSSSYPEGRVEPVRFVQTTAFAHALYDSGRTRGYATVDWTHRNFRDTKSLAADGSVVGIVDQDARDESVLRGSLLGERSVTPVISLFIQGIASTIRYRRVNPASGLLDLDGSSYTTLGGISFRSSRLIEGSIGFGYVWRSYDAPSLRTIGGIALNADLRYFVTPLVTLSATASRTVEEAVLQSVSKGFLSTAGSIRADYELRRPLILSAGAEYRRNTFRQDPRRDSIFTAFGGARYSLNRHAALRFDVSYDRRRARNAPFVPSFDSFTASVGLHFTL